MQYDYTFTATKPDHISHSQIELGHCLYKYKELRLKSQARESEPMREGKFVHEVIYKYTRYCVENKTPADFDEFEIIYDDLFRKYKITENNYIEIRNNLLEFAEAGIRFDVYLEAEERCKIEFSPGKFIEAVFDRTNLYQNERGTILEIIDYKNSYKLMSAADVGKNTQLKIYKYLICNFMDIGKFDFIRCGIYNTRYNIMRWTEFEKINDLSDEFESISKFLDRQWDRLLLSEEYMPTECDQCWIYGGCELMDRCPLYTPEKLKEMQGGGLEQRIRAYKKIELDRKKLIKTIQKELETRAGIKVGDQIVGYTINPGYKYDLKKLLDYFKKYKIKDFDMDISKTEAENIIKKFRGPIKKLMPEEFADLENAKIETASSKFII